MIISLGIMCLFTNKMINTLSLLIFCENSPDINAHNIFFLFFNTID